MWRRNQNHLGIWRNSLIHKEWAGGASDLNLNWNTIQCYLEQLIWKGFHTKLGPWLMCIACFEVMQVTDRFYIWIHFMGSDFGPINWNFLDLEGFSLISKTKQDVSFFLKKTKKNLYCTLLHLLDFLHVITMYICFLCVILQPGQSA